MTTDIAIRVTNLSKCYQIYDAPHDRLKQFVVPKLCRAFPPPVYVTSLPHTDRTLNTSNRI
jgi:lipopolysaccharide transport system ATP-binding protein